LVEAGVGVHKGFFAEGLDGQGDGAGLEGFGESFFGMAQGFFHLLPFSDFAF
jgi:hypothetical protein